jgi:hypothetical protein
MNIPRIGKFGVAAIAFCAGVGLCFFGPTTWRRLVAEDQAEEMRATSPNGNLDAVMTRQPWGGGAGGFEWRVFIVLKGKAAPQGDSHALFQAGTLTGEKLVWNQPHLLEIHFDVADIEQFRNLWGLYEVQDVGPTGEHGYDVEVRLVPSSPDFSLLTPEGAFRRTY